MQEQRSYADSLIDGWYDSLLTQAGRRFAFESEVVLPFHEWVTKVILDGRPFSFDRREYLLEAYQDDHPFQVEIKSTQTGNTSKAMLRSAYKARYGDYRNILYYFPNKVAITKFVKGRFDPLITENPETIKPWIHNTDSVSIKQIWRCFLHFDGLGTKLAVKSTPGDFLVIDELDEAPAEAVYMATKRLSASEYKHKLYLSNPTLPDYGIDKEFQDTDQRFWMLRCPKCGEHTCLEDTFPNCLHERPSGEVVRLCQSCKAGILDPSVGQWVAKRPGIEDKRGRHYSQLFSQFVDPKEILKEFKTTNNLGQFYNLVIGLAYVEAENRLIEEEVLALCGSDPIRNYCTDPCFMGVDQGKDLHVVIGRKHNVSDGELIHLSVYKDFEELDRLMKLFNVNKCVIDALPETRKAREFANRHPGRVFLCYYSERKEGPYVWNEKTQEVKVNRTESMDASHAQLAKAKVILPRQCDVVRDFAKHCHATARKLEEEVDESGQETGKKRYTWVRLGEDHFRHAFNYETMARQSAPKWLFPELQ